MRQLRRENINNLRHPNGYLRNFVLRNKRRKKDHPSGGEGVCITPSGNILVNGNISLSLFMTPLETIELLIF